jgi:cytoskeletal protein RodZ
MKIQEQPVPVEAMLKPPSHTPKVLIIIVVALAALGVIGGAVYFFTQHVSWKNASKAKPVRKAVAYTLEGTSLEERMYKGDSVNITLGKTSYKVSLANLGEAVTLETPSGKVILDLGQPVEMDINSDGTNDTRVTALDFVKNNPDTGVRLRFALISSAGAAPAANAASAGTPAAQGTEAAQEASSTVPPQASTSAGGSTTILSAANAYPFTIQVSFQGYCMFRWQVLRERDNRDRQERYFVRGDEVNIQAQNGIRIWVSNAASLKIQVIGAGRTTPLDIGGPGEVVVADIEWVRTEDGRFNLVLQQLD